MILLTTNQRIPKTGMNNIRNELTTLEWLHFAVGLHFIRSLNEALCFRNYLSVDREQLTRITGTRSFGLSQRLGKV